MLLSASNITKEFVTGTVLNKVSFHLEDHDRLAVVGINGAGKTTLLRILLGESEPDSGVVALSKDKTVGYLSQDSTLLSDNTIYDELLHVKQSLLDMENQIRAYENDMNHTEGTELEELMEKYTALTHSYDLQGGNSYLSEINGVLKGLGFLQEDYNKTIGTLSGGQKTRVALGKLLLQSPDLIVLDEPTNHLDLNSIAWLETYLQNYKGAVLLVSHDRFFLDKICNKILELESGCGTLFTGNYSAYAEKKKLLRNAQMNAYLNQQREIKHQEEVINKLKSFNREKSIRRAESREKALEKTVRLDKPVEINDSMHLTLTPHRLSGEDVLSVKDLKKSYGDNLLFTDVNIEIKRGEHVAIIGDNGTGKTTLLKILNRIETATLGSFTLGTNVEIGYYDQEHHVLHPEKTLYDEIADEYPYLTITEIRNTLATFLFTGDDVFKKIESLSGGERGRVSLAKLMLSDCNFLILDEPTNHLDMVSKEILENAINSYEGTVLYVSHDRYFINHTASRILELYEKHFINFIGNYDYYLEKKDALHGASGSGTESGVRGASGTPSPSVGLSNVSTESTAAMDWKADKARQAKKKKAETELKKCEEHIAELEEHKEELETQLGDPSLGNNLPLLQDLTRQLQDVSEKLEAAYEQWEVLSLQLEDVQ